MEKTIKLTMQENKTVDIALDGDVKYSISENNRTISAETIYNILEYKYGDTYVVKADNPNKKDVQVLIFFKELFDDIIAKINELEVSDL